jgi:hypothetical protein
MFHGSLIVNYAKIIVTYEISKIVSELSGLFEWGKSDKKEEVDRVASSYII